MTLALLLPLDVARSWSGYSFFLTLFLLLSNFPNSMVHIRLKYVSV